MLFSVALLALSAALGLASPLDPRAAPDNTVLIRSATECKFHMYSVISVGLMPLRLRLYDYATPAAHRHWPIRIRGPNAVLLLCFSAQQ